MLGHRLVPEQGLVIEVIPDSLILGVNYAVARAIKIRVPEWRTQILPCDRCRGQVFVAVEYQGKFRARHMECD